MIGNPFQGGLLGMGGLNGLAPEPQGLLGQYYDQDAVRKATIKNMLMLGGLGLMGGGWEGAAKGAATAAISTPNQYRDMAMDAFQMDQSAQDQAWQDEQRARERDAWGREDAAYAGMPEDVRKYYDMGGQGLASQYIQATDPAFRTADNRKTYAPIPYDMGGGKIGWGIPAEDGTFTPVPAPEGANFLSPYDKAYQTKAGGNAADQITSAPGDISAADTALDLLNQIEQDAYIDRGTGASALGNVLPGTGGYDFEQLVNQAKSGAFLTAIQQLKGMGALSNAEGQTATAAVTRMNPRMSKEAFLKALQDYRAIVERGRMKASQLIQQAPMPVPGAPAGQGEYTIEEIP